MTLISQCPKCRAYSGDDWTQCGGLCPLENSPHFNPMTKASFGPLMLVNDSRSKVEHVRAALADDPAPSGHGCHWPGCTADVPPAAWGCRKHWYALPRGLRARIWAAYRPGQETTKTPSAAYVAVAREAQAWIAANG